MLNKWTIFSQCSCVLCGLRTRQPSGLCRDCQALLPSLEHGCRQCSLPLPTGHSGRICGECLQTPPAFDHVLSLYQYDHPIDYLIRRIKFHASLASLHSLGCLLLQRIIDEATGVDALLPVPLHAARLRQRGFNQALELARPIARQLQLPLIIHDVSRRRATAPQSSLPLRQRAQNIKDAFQLEHRLPYRSVAIIDDVMTTGQTVSALAQLLKSHGVEQVSVWCIARSVRQT